MAAADYYKQNRQPAKAGRLLMLADRPLEASQLFLSEPPSYKEAEEAIFAAYKMADDLNKRDLLMQNVRLLLGRAENVFLATERVRLLEKEFPGQKHPFGYYLKSADKRVADLFNRISFSFVRKLLYFLDNEFPQLNLVNRPLVSVQKIKGTKYRVMGTYKGDVMLNEDKLSNIHMTFWLWDDRWHLVSTNLTTERGSWANKERERMKNHVFSSEQMLQYMENVFKSQFPKHAFHESVSSPQIPNKNISQ